MKLKVGDRVIENDGIVILTYEIVRVDGKIAIGASQFEGKTYYTEFLTKYWSRKRILKPNQSPTDFTIRYLPNKKTSKHGEYSSES